MRFATTIAASAAGALLVAIGIVFGQLIKHSSELDPVPVGGPFELVDQDGHTVNDKTFLGRPSVIFFGYTSARMFAQRRSWTFLTGLRRLARCRQAQRPVHFD